jgi:hypothetical protein
MARNIARKPKKKVISNARKSVAAEEKHVGRETTDWSSIPADRYQWAVYETLRHYGYFYDSKDSFKWAAEWIKANMEKEALREFKASQDRLFPMTAGGLCKIMLNGGKITEKARSIVDREISAARKRGIIALTEKTEEDSLPQKKTIADIMKENTSNFIAQIEGVLDDRYRGVWQDVDEYSVYNELKRMDLPAVTAKAIVDYYTPIRDEIDELINQKTPDLVEGYRNLSAKEKRDYLKLLNNIIEDAERYQQSKKAVRKTRAKLPKSASQQVSKVKYLKESNEFKLTSIDPSKIVGADTVYLFNTKSRQVICLTTNDAGGFKVQGTTIQNFDEKASNRRTIRKPEEFFTEFMKATKSKSVQQYNALTTKPAPANGRINEHMIILKAYT